MLYRKPLLVIIALTLLLAACNPSPEGRRSRAGGSGADIGNWGHPVNIHGDVDRVRHIYYNTPDMGKGIETSGSTGAIHPEPPGGR
jgi:hypothetical protein